MKPKITNITGLKPYSVMLEYPDYMDGGTYYSHIMAGSAKVAVEEARDLCTNENWNPHEDCSFIDRPDDLRVLLVLEGHHDDINPGD
jgi:hypothetical protein